MYGWHVDIWEGVLYNLSFGKCKLAVQAMAPHSSTLAWKIPWTEEPGGLQSMGSLESDMTEQLHFHFSLSCIGEGNGGPLQCSCLENPRDGGAWWAAVYGVAQGRTWLKRLSSSSSSKLSLVSQWLRGKESACNTGDGGSIHRSRRFPGERYGNPFQYSCLGNPMDRGARWATVYGITKSRTWLRDWMTTTHLSLHAYQNGYSRKNWPF